MMFALNTTGLGIALIRSLVFMRMHACMLCVCFCLYVYQSVCHNVCLLVLDELQKRNEVIRAVTKRVHVVEAREKEGHRELNSTQQQLLELGKKQQYTSQHCHDLKVQAHTHTANLVLY